MLGIIYRRSSGGGGGGASFLYGNGAPTVTVGSEGDSYIDRQNPSLYGPKTNGMWPAPIPLGGTSTVSKMDSTDPFEVTTPGEQTITLPVPNPVYAELYYNGIIQPESFFTINGNVATISAALQAQRGDMLEITFETVTFSNVGNTGGGSGSGDSSIPVTETPSGVINGANKIFALSYTPILNTLNVYVNGLRINLDDYSLNGSSIILNVAPLKRIEATYYR